MNYLNAVGALAALGLGVHMLVIDEGWGWAVLFFVLAAPLVAWSVDDRREKRAAFKRAVEDVPLPPLERVRFVADPIRKGVEPVETPSDDVPLTWADHDRDCEICRRRKGDVT